MKRLVLFYRKSKIRRSQRRKIIDTLSILSRKVICDFNFATLNELQLRIICDFAINTKTIAIVEFCFL